MKISTGVFLKENHLTLERTLKIIIIGKKKKPIKSHYLVDLEILKIVLKIEKDLIFVRTSSVLLC